MKLGAFIDWKANKNNKNDACFKLQLKQHIKFIPSIHLNQNYYFNITDLLQIKAIKYFKIEKNIF